MQRLRRSIDWYRDNGKVSICVKLMFAYRFIYAGFNELRYVSGLGVADVHHPWWEVQYGSALPFGVEMAVYHLLDHEDTDYIASSFRQ